MVKNINTPQDNLSWGFNLQLNNIAKFANVFRSSLKRERTYGERLIVAQLVKGIYADAKSKLYVAPPFGLQHDQWRSQSNRIVMQAHWYNANGFWLGSGDIAAYDLVVVSKQILSSELFVVIAEESLRRYNLHVGKDLDIKLISQIAKYVVALEKIFTNSAVAPNGQDLKIEGYGDAEVVDPDEILEMMRSYRIVNC